MARHVPTLIRYTRNSMTGERYRLKTPTLAIMNQSERLTLMVPGGAIVQVTAEPLGEDRPVQVDWEGKALLMFMSDIRERCEPLD